MYELHLFDFPNQVNKRFCSIFKSQTIDFLSLSYRFSPSQPEQLFVLIPIPRDTRIQILTLRYSVTQLLRYSFASDGRAEILDRELVVGPARRK